LRLSVTYNSSAACKNRGTHIPIPNCISIPRFRDFSLPFCGAPALAPKPSLLLLLGYAAEVMMVDIDCYLLLRIHILDANAGAVSS